MTLTELFTNIANAIREKKGTTESIVAENFPSEIESISGGEKTVLPDGIKFKESTFSSIDLSNADTSNITDMSNMFYSCTSLTSMDLGSNFKTSNVTTIQHMFNGCTSLTSVNFNNFNAQNITSMGSAFSGCTALTSVNFGNIDTSNVTSMQMTFDNCTSLRTINMSNINTSNITSVRGLFYNCSNLAEIDISNFDLHKCTGSQSLNNMFGGCTSLTNASLNSILKAISTAKISRIYKKLKNIGLKEEQATTCTTLSNWAECEAAGWATGY